MVTVLLPITIGIDALHLFVPVAVPAAPVFVDQVTLVTPTLSVAVPVNTIAATDVVVVLQAGV